MNIHTYGSYLSHQLRPCVRSSKSRGWQASGQVSGEGQLEVSRPSAMARLKSEVWRKFRGGRRGEVEYYWHWSSESGGEPSNISKTASMPITTAELTTLLERLATELPACVLIVVLRPLPGVELARLAVVHKTFWTSLCTLRQLHPAGPQYASPNLSLTRGWGRLERAAAFGDVAVLRALLIEKQRNQILHLHQALRTVNAWEKVDLLLCLAAQTGQLQAVELLLDAAADVHWSKDSAIHMAAMRGHADVAALLIASGADVHARGHDMLLAASAHGHVDLVKILLEHDASSLDQFDMRAACDHGHADVIEVLFQHGVQVPEDGLLPACEKGHASVVKLLLQHSASSVDLESALCCAGGSGRGYADVVSVLIDAGAYIDADDGLALCNAAKRDRADVVRLLIEHGADANSGNSAALRVAISSGCARVVDLLTQSGAKIYHTALRDATRRGDAEVVTVLLKNGADANQEDEDDALSALEVAADAGHAAIVVLLIHFGANIHTNGDFALRHAVNNGHTAVANLLMQHGAQLLAE